MNLDFILDPIKSYAPRILGAFVLLLLAWILAGLFRMIVRKIVRSSGVDKRLRKGEVGTDRNQYPVAQGAGTAVFWIIWALFLLAILEVLGLKGVLNSITVLLEKIFAAIPNILAALIVLVIFYLLARLLESLVTKALIKGHFNDMTVKLGLTSKPVEGASSPSSLVGYIVLVLTMLIAIVMAAELLGFTVLVGLVSDFVELLFLVVLGLIVIGIGIFVANLVAGILRNGGRSNTTISLVRVSIIVLSASVGLRAMGFANDIILLAFGLMMGAVAVAAALAFGLGGRKVAGELLARWTKTDDSSR